MYVAAYTGDTLSIYSRDAVTGSLTFQSLLRDEEGGIDSLNGAQGVSVSADGKNVYVAAYYDSALTVFDRNVATGALSLADVFKDGVDGVDGLRYAREVILSADGRNVYVTGGTDDAVVAFERDLGSGELVFLSFHQDGIEGVDGLDSPRGIAAAPDGKNVYVAGSEDNALAVFNRLSE